MYHIPHGRLNAILLPAVVSCNAHRAGKKYAEIARAAGMGGSADTIALRNLKNGLIRLRRELNLPETLAQAGVDPRSVWRQRQPDCGGSAGRPLLQNQPNGTGGFSGAPDSGRGDRACLNGCAAWVWMWEPLQPS